MGRYQVHKRSDQDLIKIFAKAASLIAPARVPKFEASVPINVDWKAELAAKANNKNPIFTSSSFLIDSAKIFIKTSDRYGNPNQETNCVTYERKPDSSLYDQVVFFSIRDLDLTDKQDSVVACIHYLQKELGSGFSLEESIAGVAEEHLAMLKTLEQTHVNLLNSFQGKFQEVVQETASQKDAFEKSLRKQFKEESSAIKEKADQKIEENNQKLAEEKASLQEKLDEQLERIRKREEEIEALKLSLDDRNNTHVRREIRKDLLKEIEARSSGLILSQPTKKKQWPIIAAMVFLSTGLVLMAVWSAIDLSTLFGNKESTTATLFYGGLRQIAYSGGAVAAIIYLIRWYNRWFTRHAEEEFFIKRFQLDIERASWVVETVLEWEKEKGADKQMPELLLRSLTRNLFQDQTKTVEPVVHPADQLASALFGTASKVRLKSGENEVELNARRLSRTKPSPQEGDDN